MMDDFMAIVNGVKFDKAIEFLGYRVGNLGTLPKELINLFPKWELKGVNEITMHFEDR
jgi:hypothetical protein